MANKSLLVGAGGSAQARAHAHGGIGARVTNSVAIPVPSFAVAFFTVLSFDTERRDDGGCFDSANPTRLTAPVAGWYGISGSVSFAPVAQTGWRQLRHRLNGTLNIAVDISPTVTAAANHTRITVTTFWYMAAGDYVELLASQNNDTNTTVNIDKEDAFSPEFSIVRISS